MGHGQSEVSARRVSIPRDAQMAESKKNQNSMLCWSNGAFGRCKETSAKRDNFRSFVDWSSDPVESEIR